MKTLNNLKLRIMVRAFRIRLNNGEAFEDIAADYPALTTDDLEAIKAALEP
ncbi:MAG TPA: antitoxin [Faecalibacterium sp.]|nr:antitoxin [Faecalibacterium sp.]